LVSVALITHSAVAGEVSPELKISFGGEESVGDLIARLIALLACANLFAASNAAPYMRQTGALFGLKSTAFR
jgi:hypothetical protein